MSSTPVPIFLSVVLVVRQQAAELPRIVTEATQCLSRLVADYEIIVVDNASDDDSVATLKQLAADSSVPNLQVYALTKQVDADTGSWVGLENALGDYIAVLDPESDDIAFLPTLLERAISGSDAVFAANDQKSSQGLVYRVCYHLFDLLYRVFTGIRLTQEAPRFRVLSRRVVNFVLQHPSPALSYRHLPATAGFAKTNLSYSARPSSFRKKSIVEGVDRGMRLLVATTRGPMRFVAAISLFGALANLVYSGYVIGIAIWKDSVEPGWVTLSLQQSGMFLLISLGLGVLGEYTGHMARVTNEGPPYHVAQEFTSRVMTRRQRLNIEELSGAESTSSLPPAPASLVELEH